mmetsp:Transcript_17087/g.51065  ORF Transcript_17087/g.51065 Transcript_17087/m.51065 type:complete len:306 (-) Transcript_17087:193-1110(-)
MSVEELRSNLATYETQRAQVDDLLQQDASNVEFQELRASLVEVIELTQELLREALQSEAATQPSPAAAAASAPTGGSWQAAPVVVQSQAPAVSSFLPPQVAQQIRAAQQRAALAGDAPAAWAIGARCQAVWSGDGEWYPAKVDGVSAQGNFVVTFDEDGGVEEVVRGNVKEAAEEAQAYRGVSAPTRNSVNEEVAITEMPQWLEIQPEDDEKTVNKKKKLQKAHKSKMRFAKLDKETKERQSSWQNFQKGTVKKKKKPAGFIGLKKTSMFSVPEGIGGKVGVTGSGRAMTEAPNRGRHDFSNLQG